MTVSDKAQVGAIMRKILEVLVHLHEDGKTRDALLNEIGRLIEKFDN